jgi:hypothetical protein
VWPKASSPGFAKMVCWCQWLMPVILATQEAEIRRIVAPSQLGRKKKGGAGGVAQSVSPEFKPQYRKKKKRWECGRSWCESQP